MGVNQSPSPTPPLCTMVHTPVYYGPHPCVLWSTPLCTMVHTLCTMEEKRVRGEEKSTQALERAYGGRPIPLPHPTPVYYGPHPCVLWSTPLCTTVHTPVYYGPHPCVLWSTPLCTMVHTPVYYGPHPCVLWSTPLCTMVHTLVYYGPHPCVLWSTPLCTMVHTPVYYGPHTCGP